MRSQAIRIRALRASLTRAISARADDLAAAAREEISADPTLIRDAAAADRRGMSAADQIWEADLARAPAADGWASIDWLSEAR